MINHRIAVFVVFALNGAAFGSWAPRMPALAETLRAEPGTLGLALLGASVGMVLAASFCGRAVERFGARLGIAVPLLVGAAALPLIGLVDSIPLLAAVLLVLGAATGVVDVAMNVAGVAIERAGGKAVMPVLHAGFSVGAMLGAGGAALAARQGLSVAKHLSVVAVITALVLLAVIKSVPKTAAAASAEPVVNGKVAGRPVLWLLASIALCSAIAEGGSADWSALLLVTEHGMAQDAAALGYAAFAGSMAIARFAGAWTQNRFGAARTLCCGAVLASAGLLISALVPGGGYLGFVMAGAGLAGAFPIALGLAGAAGRRPDGSGGEREIAFVSALAYSGFLFGPPMIGGIAQLTSLSLSFVAVGLTTALIAPAAVAATRSLARERAAAEEVRTSVPSGTT
ncbi:MFS transporter [Allokutzneria multivorans]|uniref:MFS transporter n=1 Tax=Allokutzneria multivorans TaxID=1142134 RepID=A0ABP7RU29_9PSEU